MKRYLFQKFFQTWQADIFGIGLLILSSLILLFDTLFFRGQPANMDGTVHITNIAIFHQALEAGDFPVRWTDGFANYGLPMGSFAQQLTSYLGGFLTFFSGDVITAFNWVYVIGTITSVLAFYLFLRLHVSAWPATVGAFLFNFAPYRIINFYIRGALPEYFSSLFVITLLIGFHLYIKKKQLWSLLLITLSTWGLVLSHPMNAITGSVILGPYLLFLLWREKKAFKLLLAVVASIGLGLVLSAYYLIPLLKEVQYLNYGSSSNHYNPSPLSWLNFFSPHWFYYLVQHNEILSRGHFITVGLPEMLLFLAGIGVWIARRIRKQTIDILDVIVVAGGISLFLTTQLADGLYRQIDVLSNIQFPWRMLSTFIFIPGAIAAYGLQKFHWPVIGLVLIILISWMRFPEVYGKNFTDFPQSHYYFTIDNLHTANMNTVWTARTTEYPVEATKVGIIEGEGRISELAVGNSVRKFTVEAKTSLRLVDYTFYFPGWNVYVDGQAQPIEFQDVNYRGVITYRVPVGRHQIEVLFEETKTVKIGNLISLVGWGVFCLFALITLTRTKNFRWLIS
ncbi:MAG: hypothetical protein COU66_00545 [Candidatus Pacebacteria bacterium CG10_big_fil_rev_8_21_14_0_10_44_11]|nr:MAG: hypothetical protein COU66_00545 [Candidatus Pacebacteria bacterium CG10_big_fil_rev_8_21_14_0_10_44_11]